MLGHDLYVFGGESQSGGSSGSAGLYKYDINAASWTPIRNPVSGSVPSARVNSRMVSYNGTLIVSGGHKGGGYYHDVHTIIPKVPADCPLTHYLSPYLKTESAYGTRFCVSLVATDKGPGEVIGDNPNYGMNSYLPHVAVHAGLATRGEEVVFDVIIQPKNVSSRGVVRNGIKSHELLVDDWNFQVQTRGSCPLITNDEMDEAHEFYAVDSSSLYQVNAYKSVPSVVGGQQSIGIVSATRGDDDALSEFKNLSYTNDSIAHLWDSSFDTFFQFEGNLSNPYLEFELERTAVITSMQIWAEHDYLDLLYTFNRTQYTQGGSFEIHVDGRLVNDADANVPLGPHGPDGD